MDQAKLLTGRRLPDLAFLGLAVLVHAALLLLPLKDWRNLPPVANPRLTVDLRYLPPPTPAETRPPVAHQALVAEPEPARASEAEPLVIERRTAQIRLDELPQEPQETPSDEPLAEQKPITARQLRELARQSDLRKDTTTVTRQLGSSKPWQPPDNWKKHAGAPYLAESDNRFNGITVPEEVEIVDRWMASDGSHNVVLNLPNGETLCGRAEAYNPMQPLVEPVMMFRTCGGGGKRSFTMPDRYRKGQ